MSESSFFCPHCGARIAIEARVTQGELPLGPIELKNKLDYLGTNLQAERPRGTDRIESISESSSFSSHPLAERESIRFVPDSPFASCEEDLIDSIRKIVGEKDWAKNGAGWRSVVKHCRLPISHALEDWKLNAHRHHEIRNRAAWLSDRFKRAKEKQERPNPQRTAAKCFSTRKIEGR